jgi:DNA-binding HxlR family transcriptional regulator
MIPDTQQRILKKLMALCELSAGIRTGQLLAHLDFLAQDMFDDGLSELEDDQLLRVLERHELELSQRKSNVA